MRRAALSLSLARLAAAATARAEEKLTADAIVARHLEALAGADPKAAQVLRVVEGPCRFEIMRGGMGTLDGKARVASEGRRYGVELRFPSSEYPGESLAYDGKTVQVGFIQPRRRSPMSEFLNTYDFLLREGLVSGALSSAWSLLDVAGRAPKLKYAGLKKVGNEKLHEIDYKAARGQGDVDVRLYFDPATFRHVRSQYRIRLLPSMSEAIDQSASQQDTRFEMEETFSDFQAAGGLTLPRKWVITFSMDGPSTNAFWRWDSVVERVTAATAP